MNCDTCYYGILIVTRNSSACAAQECRNHDKWKSPQDILDEAELARIEVRGW